MSQRNGPVYYPELRDNWIKLRTDYHIDLREIGVWCISNIEGRWDHSSQSPWYDWFFENDTDAMAFKLRWI